MKNDELPRIVIIGGGTGLPVLLRGLKTYPFDITAIVTVADDGGSSGRLREDLNIPPPGDIRNVLAALSDVEPLIEEMFQHRFNTANELSGHSLGNLDLSRVDVDHRRFCPCHSGNEQGAECERKSTSGGKSKRHSQCRDGRWHHCYGRIENSLLRKKNQKGLSETWRTIMPLSETIQAIREADLLSSDLGACIQASCRICLYRKLARKCARPKRRKVYICNLMTQAGETHDFTASDHVKAIYDHMRCASLIRFL